MALEVHKRPDMTRWARWLLGDVLKAVQRAENEMGFTGWVDDPFPLTTCTPVFVLGNVLGKIGWDTHFLVRGLPATT
jgi:hypothetical protein